MTASRERGSAVVELVLFVPLLVLLAMAATFTVRTLLDYSHVNEISEAGARYATRVSLDPAGTGAYRFRPSAGDVEAEIRRLAQVPIDAVEVSPDPANARPGTVITVTVRARRPLGPVGRAVNGVAGAFAGLFGGDKPFPDDGVAIDATAAMREE